MHHHNCLSRCIMVYHHMLYHHISPVHTLVRIVGTASASSEAEIELLPWPVCSPDISPIENLRSMLSQRLAKDTPPFCRISLGI
ncbi:UNVERIFIED_CONTAM: hypothetical protein NCL1_36306 [Trichonephila clavipes]